MSERAVDLIARFRRMEAKRSEWDAWFQVLGEVFLPNQADFTTKSSKGKKRDTRNFENSHRVAARNFATTIDTFIGPQSKEQLTVVPDDEELAERDDVRIWLDTVRSRMWRAMNRTSARRKQAKAETDQSLVVFGTGVMFIGENRTRDGLLFRSHHLRDVALGENAAGEIDRLGKREMLTARLAVEKYGVENVGQRTREELTKKEETEFEFIQMVLPREDRDAAVFATSMAYASVVVDVSSEHIVSESGFHEFPFAVPRWETSPAEVYGRSPAMLAYSDARTLQSIAKTLLLGGQRAVDPPTWVFNDAAFSAVRMYPGGTTVFDAASAAAAGGRLPAGVFEMGKNIPLGREMQADYRELVQSAFFRDLFASAIDGPDRTATEILERKEEMIRVLGPTFGRLEEDYPARIDERVFNLMERSGSFPERPEAIRGSGVSFSYHSPLQIARASSEAIGISRSFELMAPLAEADPSVLDNYDTDQIARDTPKWFGFGERYIRPQDAVDALRERRAQAQQEQAALEQAQAGSEAVKNIAVAERDIAEAQ